MLTINLPPELEDQVRQNAAAQGADADTYASRLVLLALYQPVPPVIPAKTPSAESLARWVEQAKQATARAVPVTDAQLHEPAFRREEIYGDDGR